MLSCCYMHSHCSLFSSLYQHCSSQVFDTHNNYYMTWLYYCLSSLSIHCPQSDTPCSSSNCCHCYYTHRHTVHKSYCHHYHLSCIHPSQSMYSPQSHTHSHCSPSSSTHHYSNYCLHRCMPSSLDSYCNSSTQSHLPDYIHSECSDTQYN